MDAQDAPTVPCPNCTRMFYAVVAEHEFMLGMCLSCVENEIVSLWAERDKLIGFPGVPRVEWAKRQIEAEDQAARARFDTPERKAIIADNTRRCSLPSEHPDHLCGMHCDGQDGGNSYCARLRRKLFGNSQT